MDCEMKLTDDPAAAKHYRNFEEALAVAQHFGGTQHWIRRAYGNSDLDFDASGPWLVTLPYYVQDYP